MWELPEPSHRSAKHFCNSSFITARVRSTTGWYCFHRCLSVHTRGQGVPQGRHPLARSGWGHPKVGTPLPVQGRYPSGKVRMWGGAPQGRYPSPSKVGTHLSPARSGRGEGVPQGRCPQHLLHSGQYASCVHAEGLSC